MFVNERIINSLNILKSKNINSVNLKQVSASRTWLGIFHKWMKLEYEEVTIKDIL